MLLHGINVHIVLFYPHNTRITHATKQYDEKMRILCTSPVCTKKTQVSPTLTLLMLASS